MRFVRIYRKSSITHSLLRGLSLLVYWQLWMERCRRLFEDHKLHSSSLLKSTIHLWKLQVHNISPKAGDTKHDLILLHAINVKKPETISRQVKWIAWRFPEEGMLKLNIDGASKGNPGMSGGGVILRNSTGQLVLAGYYFYGLCSSVEAEMRALLDGLIMIRDFGLMEYSFLIESDSKLLVDMVKHNNQASWKFWSIIHQIRSILNSLDFQIQHSYREGNTVADS